MRASILLPFITLASNFAAGGVILPRGDSGKQNDIHMNATGISHDRHQRETVKGAIHAWFGDIEKVNRFVDHPWSKEDASDALRAAKDERVRLSVLSRIHGLDYKGHKAAKEQKKILPLIVKQLKKFVKALDDDESGDDNDDSKKPTKKGKGNGGKEGDEKEDGKEDGKEEEEEEEEDDDDEEEDEDEEEEEDDEDNGDNGKEDDKKNGKEADDKKGNDNGGHRGDKKNRGSKHDQSSGSGHKKALKKLIGLVCKSRFSTATLWKSASKAAGAPPPPPVFAPRACHHA